MTNFRRSIYELFAITAGLLLGLFPLSGRNLEIPTPVFQDDYINLSYFGNPFNTVLFVRPVTYYSIWALGWCGDFLFYFTLFALLCTFLLEVHRLSSRYFYKSETIFGALAKAFFLGLIISFFENAYEYTTFTGVIANLISANLAMISLFLFLKIIDKKDVLKQPVFLAFASLFYGLSLLAKEDFALLPLAVFCIEYYRLKDRGGSERKDLLISASVLLVVGFLILIYNYWIKSPFLFGAHFYEHSRSFKDVAHVFLKYTAETRYSKVLSLFWVVGWLLIVFRKSDRRFDIIIFTLLPVLLIAPFLALRDHTFLFYAMNWLPFVVVSVLFSAARFPRYPILFCLIAGVLAYSSFHTRFSNLKDLQLMQKYNRNIIRFLSENKADINLHSVFGVAGMCDTPSPWGQNDVGYLKRRINVTVMWKIFCPENSLMATFFSPIPSGTELVKTAPGMKLSDIGKDRNLSFIYFDADGNGKIYPPSFFQTGKN
jgi:hypothetical protein